MILMLEGANGAGKTAYAKKLSRVLGYPIYRAFRGNAEKCDYGLLEKMENEFGLKANCHIDHIYMADFFGAIDVDVILDRTYPSSLAYDHVYKENDPGKSAAGYRFWLKQIKKFDCIYVWLEVDYDTASRRRSGFTPKRKEHDALCKAYDKAFSMLSIPKLRINTGETAIEKGVIKICQALKK